MGRETGVMVEWKGDKSFGFVKPDEGGADLLVHKSQVTGGAVLSIGSIVTFERRFNGGKYAAMNVALAFQNNPAAEAAARAMRAAQEEPVDTIPVGVGRGFGGSYGIPSKGSGKGMGKGGGQTLLDRFSSMASKGKKGKGYSPY
eukprot:gnl/MRDRNA2_/MRDRNA2_115470_c0_seq1.p1 gnl/MRDRNA2_/MRDRNA2_115470_c0~~gnl/MRDRNA2_/MRDRNA2_115470_c0_seq1.p1  ORF type:complete len:144 (+),score=30.33 gnl/MRDRNA2_/MRDRNA2_115470_c0_seq1:88-519(+)